MGSGSSTLEGGVPDALDKTQTQLLAGDRWDEARFDAMAKDGHITRAQLEEAAGVAADAAEPADPRHHICFLEDTKLEGGTQIWVAEAARWFRAQGWEVTMVTPEGGFNAADAQKIEGCRLVTYDYTGVEKMDTAAVELWRGAFEPCDVIVMTVHPPRKDGALNRYDEGFFHVSMLASRALAAGRLRACLLAKTGSIVAEYRKEFYTPEITPPINNQVVAITGFTRRYLVEEYGIPAERVTLCYQGTDVSRFLSDPARKEEALRRYPAPEGAFPHFCCIGAYELRKGQKFLVSAMAEVVREFPQAFLTLVGKNGRDGDIEGELQAAVTAAGIEASVAFHPFTKEPMYVYEAIDAVVVSSLMEGLPNVLLESLAMKKPCVSTNIAGCPECVHDGVNGWLCEPSDAQSLAAAMKNVCAAGRDGCAALGEAGSTFVRGKMDKKAQFADFKRVFQRAVAQSGPLAAAPAPAPADT
eukprot:g846.t1